MASTVSDGDLQAIGAALLGVIVSVQRAGHVSPASTLDYMTDVDSPEASGASRILRDFIAWTSGRTSVAPGCADRLKALVQTSGWEEQCLESLDRQLFPSNSLTLTP